MAGKEKAIVSIALPKIAVGGSKILELKGKTVLLCRTQRAYHCVGALCPHQNKTLEGCRVRDDHIMCPHHGARFSLMDGAPLSPLTKRRLPVFKMDVNGDQLLIDLSP